MNKVMFIGYVGNDPDRYDHNGSVVANFSVAVSDGRGEYKTTTWYRCSAWNGLAEKVILPHVKKGSYVLIEGKLKPEIRVYESNGEHRANYEVVVSNFEFLSSKGDFADSGDTTQPAVNTSKTSFAKEQDPFEDDENPF